MKTFFLHALAAFMLALAPLACTAQTGGGDPQARAEQITDLMDERLALTDEQYDKIMVINRDAFTQMAEVRAQNPTNGSGDRRSQYQLMQKMRPIMQKRDTQINELLTDDQKIKYAASKEEFRQRMMERRGSGSGSGTTTPK